MGQGMIVTWTLVAIAFAALATLAYVALRNRTRQVDLDKAVRAFQSLDIEAFTNLIDPEEDAFLRDNLSPKKFREIKRQRAWAALLYSREAGRAAAALAKIGQAARRSSDAKIAESGVQLSENAFRLRLQTIKGCFHFLGEILWPARSTRSLPPVVEYYQRATETFLLLRVSSGVHRFVRSNNT